MAKKARGNRAPRTAKARRQAAATPEQTPPEPPRPTSTADPACQAWIDFVCTQGDGFRATPIARTREAGELPVLRPERTIARVYSRGNAPPPAEGREDCRVPTAGGEALDRLVEEAPDGVYFEVVEGVSLAALTRGELERARGAALAAYAVGRASRNVPARKQDRNRVIHAHVTSGERDWDKIRRLVLAEDSRWATKKGQPVTVKALRNDYRLWLRRRGP
jgi:hypothetical protein